MSTVAGGEKILLTFNSITYLFLLAIAVVTYWLLPKRLRPTFVFLISVLFYASWGVVFVCIPLLAATLVFFFGRQITANSSKARQWMWGGVTSLVVLLAVFKYRSLLPAHFGVTGAGSNSWLTNLAFPIGISFYTFEAISYLVDIQQRRVRIPKFLDLCLFFFFWPNILSGPIVRARELMPQLTFQKSFEARFVFAGIDRIIWGLVQKSVVANTLGIWVERGFAPNVTRTPSFVDGWFLAIAFALQIYFDFAGYTNLAIGTARLLGVTLPENFQQPYHAGTPVEFWARWHMTLSRWIRDYLFFPANAKWMGQPLVLYSSSIGIMAIVGLWHGAGWGFVLWGILHGVYLVVYRIYEGITSRWPASVERRIAPVAWRALTLIAVVVAWVPFRALNLTKAGGILRAMFWHWGFEPEYGAVFYGFTIFVGLLCVLEPLSMRILTKLSESEVTTGVSPFRVLVLPTLYALGLLLFLLFDTGNTQFIYSQF